MTQFKVGDKVVRFRDPYNSGRIGLEGTVTRVTMDDDCVEQIYVSYDGKGTAISYEAKNFKLVQTKAQPRKHAEVIKAWADGAEIQIKYSDEPNKWHACANPTWDEHHEYRVKTEPKPDYANYITVNNEYGVRRFSELDDARFHTCKKPEEFTILKLTHDGETGKVKAREIVQ